MSEFNQRANDRERSSIEGSGPAHRSLNIGQWFFGFSSLIFLLVLLFPLRLERAWFVFSTVSILEITLAGLVLVLITGAILHRRLKLGDRKVFVLLSLPVVFAVASLAWTITFGETIKSIVVYGAALGTFLVTVALFQRASAHFLATIILLCPVVLIITAISSYFPNSILRPELVVPSQALNQDGFLLSYYARFSHPFIGLSNSFATILAMFLPLILWVRQSGLWRRLSWWIAIMTLAAIIATGSRGVLLAVVVMYALFSLWRVVSTARIRRGGVLFVTVALMVAALFLSISPDAQKHLADRLSGANLVSRFDASDRVFNVLNTKPWGIGSGVPLSESSQLSLRSVHNAYLQNLLWFGLLGGTLLSLAMLMLPLVITRIPVRTLEGREAKRAVVMSVVVILLINLSQASWEGSVMRVWIYFLIGMGVALISTADRYGLERLRGRVFRYSNS